MLGVENEDEKRKAAYERLSRPPAELCTFESLMCEGKTARKRLNGIRVTSREEEEESQACCG